VFSSGMTMSVGGPSRAEQQIDVDGEDVTGVKVVVPTPPQ